MERFGVRFVAPEQDESLISKHRSLTRESGEFGIGQPDQMGNAHGVEHAAGGGLGGGQIGVAVEVEQPDVWPATLHASNDTDGDGAIATDHEGNRSVRIRLGNEISHRPCHVNHCAKVAAGGLVMINGKDFRHHVAAVVHRQTRRSEPVEQARPPVTPGAPGPAPRGGYRRC